VIPDSPADRDSAPLAHLEVLNNHVRAESRVYERHRNRQDWRTFDPDRASSEFAPAFEIVENISESRWGPRASARRVWPRTPLEVITYVRAGRLQRTGPSEADTVLLAGDFAHEIVEPGDAYVEANQSETHFADVIRILLRLEDPNLERTRQRERFSEAQRKGQLFLVASPAGDGGSLRVVRDARIFSSLLYPGRHVAHEVEPHRAVWVHVVHGAVSLGAAVLRKGDGVGVTAGAVSITAREHSEVLLVDVAC
jgi:redox-sensitive bicupin YhaK (pirin superfamily)